MNVIYEHNKLKELILYVAGRLAGDRFGGATKLNKVLYFSDFAHVRMHGRPITGAEYQKLENGPARTVTRIIDAETIGLDDHRAP